MHQFMRERTLKGVAPIPKPGEGAVGADTVRSGLGAHADRFVYCCRVAWGPCLQIQEARMNERD